MMIGTSMQCKRYGASGSHDLAVDARRNKDYQFYPYCQLLMASKVSKATRCKRYNSRYTFEVFCS
ncbi:hypothetical protein FH972_022293 [Carpinus fangiana]|uniref:Uncharacterized protein n=1 Tax=Carpinus fangiana TaxID=176857 RepID=A0A5N6KS60_9ROSI|nr:hypothetical protein FH972_022293 [Carpinus fangiana]